MNSSLNNSKPRKQIKLIPRGNDLKLEPLYYRRRGSELSPKTDRWTPGNTVTQQVDSNGPSTSFSHQRFWFSGSISIPLLISEVENEFPIKFFLEGLVLGQCALHIAACSFFVEWFISSDLTFLSSKPHTTKLGSLKWWSKLLVATNWYHSFVLNYW